MPRDIYPVRLHHRYVVQDDVVQKIELEMGEVVRYQLSKMLNDLGQPYEVWISTYSMTREQSQEALVLTARDMDSSERKAYERR